MCEENPFMCGFETPVCRVLKLKTHNRLAGDAITANAQSQGRNYPANEAKEENNLPTDMIIASDHVRSWRPVVSALYAFLKQ